MARRFDHHLANIGARSGQMAIDGVLHASDPQVPYEQEAEHIADLTTRSEGLSPSAAWPVADGFDFSHVRLHTDAAASTRTVNAETYTAGNDIVVNSGTHGPSTSNYDKPNVTFVGMPTMAPDKPHHFRVSSFWIDPIRLKLTHRSNTLEIKLSTTKSVKIVLTRLAPPKNHELPPKNAEPEPSGRPTVLKWSGLKKGTWTVAIILNDLGGGFAEGNYTATKGRSA